MCNMGTAEGLYRPIAKQQGSRALKAHDDNAIFVEFARLKKRLEIVLIVDYHGRGLDNIVLLFHR